MAIPGRRAADLAMRVALGLSYDGAAFCGWQTQPNVNTVQDAVEEALGSFLAGRVSTVCAGRTDTGVHALNQVIHLDTDAVRSPESWVRGLNALLPATVAVQWARAVPKDFHARFSAQVREYLYVIRNDRVRSPLLDGRVGWVFRTLNRDAMQHAANRMLGEHDFSCFRSSECQAASPVRHLQAIDIIEQAPYFYFRFRANAFLHHMIRNIMGTLVYVGMGRQSPEWVDTLLASQDRRLAAPTFSPAGLYLAGVTYPEQYDIPRPDSRALLHLLAGFSLPSSGQL